jgi:hypothetical protein
MAIDYFDDFKQTPGGPALRAAAVTPNDETDLAAVTVAVWVGGAGAMKVQMAGGGDPVVFAAIPAGSWLPIRVTRIYDADTDATAIVALS